MYKVGQLSGYLTHTHTCTNKSQTTMRTISTDTTSQGAALDGLVG